LGLQPGTSKKDQQAHLLVGASPIGACSENTAAIGALQVFDAAMGDACTTMAQPVEPSSRANRLSVISARMLVHVDFQTSQLFKARFLLHFNVDQDLGGGQYL
jgi:hypothetical protein